MVVHDLDVARVPTRPTEANPPLIINPNAVLPCAPSLEAFQPISGWDSQVFNSLRRVQNEKFPKRLTLNVLAPLCDSNSIEYSSCFRVRERSDHDRERVPDCVTNATRYCVSPYNNLRHLTARLTSRDGLPRLSRRNRESRLCHLATTSDTLSTLAGDARR